MMDTMEYKGYLAQIEFDGENKTFYGIVRNIRDTIHFEGTSAAELEDAFRESVETYFEFCEQCGDEPQQPCPGQLWLQIEPDLMQKVERSAAQSGKSVNAFLESVLNDWYRGAQSERN